jgi:protein-disulfide isomerase
MPENEVEQVTPSGSVADRVEDYLKAPVTHVLGNPDAPICVVEYGDFECPYCAGAAPVLRELVETSGGQVRLLWRNFPLFEVHPHSLTAALASESAAATAGETVYWLMHAKLLAHQARLNDFDLQIYSTSLGADPDYATGEAAQQFAPIVQSDYASGIEIGVSATPTLFIQGKPYDGRVDLQSLRRATGLALGDGSMDAPDAVTTSAPARRRLWQRHRSAGIPGQ